METKLKNTVNPKSKIELRFPSNSSYFIIFHGQLIHNGSSSIMNLEGKIEKSTRLFSYLRVPEYNSRYNGNNCRTSSRLKSYKNHLKEGTVDTSSFIFNEKDVISNHEIIMLPENMEKINKRNYKHTHQPVLGNMNQFGWEIYDGIDFSSTDMKGFNEELESIVQSKNLIWNGIGGTKREMYLFHFFLRVD